MRTLTSTVLATSALIASATIAAAQSTPIPSVVVSFQNLQPSRSVLFTPPWIGIHDGSFDIYDGGSAASVPLGGDEVERIAEDGNAGPLAATFAGLLPSAPQVAGLPGPFGPLAPGDRVSVTLNVDPTVDRFFSYASMIIPSNDTFVANGDPMAHMLFDTAGNFVGKNFIVSGDETNDAGTEINDEVAANVAFLGQSAPNTGASQGGVVMSPAPNLANPGVSVYPNGILTHPAFANADFNDADDRLLVVHLRYVDFGARVPYRSTLSPGQEVQSDLIDSNATGMARLMSAQGNQLLLRVVFEHLSGPVTSAHLHLGQAGTNGPIVVDLTAGLVGPDMLKFSAGAADLTGPLAGQPFLNLLNELAAGNIYINLHTAAFPAGELRGQVLLSN